jgi:SH3-like domain-containing protein
MNIQNGRYPLLKIRFIVYFSLIMFFLSLNCLNTAYAGERLAVAVSKANIRSGPGTNHELIWQVYKYYPIKIIKKTASWYQFVDFEGDRGWIHKSLVRKIPTVITIKGICNVRSGPGTKYNIAFEVEKGVAFKILKRKGSWIRVQHADEDKGWIYQPLVW